MMGKGKIVFFLLLSFLTSVVSLGRGSAWQKIKILDKKEGMWRAVRWSPDGKYILLFREAKPELFSVWILEVGKRKARKLLNEGRYEPFPPGQGVWSCDSRYIVIREYNPNTHIAKLWLLDVVKGNKKLLVEKAYDVFPLWSPKELKLVYTADEVGYARTSDEKIYLYEIPSEKKTLIYNGGDAWSFSPNGRYLSIETSQAEEEAYKWGLAMADVETLQVTPLLDVHTGFGGWSPDSEKIAYTKEPPWGGLYIMEVRSKKEEKVLSWGDWPVWSPDGRYIAFIGYGLSKPSIEVEVAMDICLLDLKTGKPRQITFNGVSSDIAFNPKSSDILAYISCTTSCAKGKVFLYFLKENKSIRLSSREIRTFEANPVQVYDWSPDGRYIAYIDGGELWIAGPFLSE